MRRVDLCYHRWKVKPVATLGMGSAQAAPVAVDPGLATVVPGDAGIEKAQYYARPGYGYRRHFGPRRFGYRPYGYGYRRHFGPRHFGHRHFGGPRGFYRY